MKYHEILAEEFAIFKIKLSFLTDILLLALVETIQKNCFIVFSNISGGGGVICICRDTGVLPLFWVLFWGCSWIFGYLFALFPDFWVSFFGLFADLWVSFFGKI